MLDNLCQCIMIYFQPCHVTPRLTAWQMSEQPSLPVSLLFVLAAFSLPSQHSMPVAADSTWPVIEQTVAAIEAEQRFNQSCIMDIQAVHVPLLVKPIQGMLRELRPTHPSLNESLLESSAFFFGNAGLDSHSAWGGLPAEQPVQG